MSLDAASASNRSAKKYIVLSNCLVLILSSFSNFEHNTLRLDSKLDSSFPVSPDGKEKNKKNDKSSLTLQTPVFVELFIESEQRWLELILGHKSTAKQASRLHESQKDLGDGLNNDFDLTLQSSSHKFF